MSNKHRFYAPQSNPVDIVFDSIKQGSIPYSGLVKRLIEHSSGYIFAIPIKVVAPGVDFVRQRRFNTLLYKKLVIPFS